MYETGAARLGMTPARYRAGGDGEDVRCSLVDTVLGQALVATTQRGICMVELGEEIFHMPVRLGVPRYSGGLSEVVRNPRYATVVGLLLEGMAQTAGILVGSVHDFREKVVLFQQAGALPASALEQVIAQAKSVDMAEVHREIAAQQSGETPS